MVWRKVGSKLILNTPKINEKNQSIALAISFSLSHHLTKQYPQILQIFFWLIKRHFPKSHRLHKIFNRNTVKVSYSCMQNMSKIYKRHNSKIASILCNQLTLCNCWLKEECPMDGKCQTMDAIYDCHATLPKGKWKKMYCNHKKSFNHKRYSHETTFKLCVASEGNFRCIPNLKWLIVRCNTL